MRRASNSGHNLVILLGVLIQELQCFLLSHAMSFSRAALRSFTDGRHGVSANTNTPASACKARGRLHREHKYSSGEGAKACFSSGLSRNGEPANGWSVLIVASPFHKIMHVSISFVLTCSLAVVYVDGMLEKQPFSVATSWASPSSLTRPWGGGCFNSPVTRLGNRSLIKASSDAAHQMTKGHSRCDDVCRTEAAVNGGSSPSTGATFHNL